MAQKILLPTWKYLCAYCLRYFSFWLDPKESTSTLFRQRLTPRLMKRTPIWCEFRAIKRFCSESLRSASSLLPNNLPVKCDVHTSETHTPINHVVFYHHILEIPLYQISWGDFIIANSKFCWYVLKWESIRIRVCKQSHVSQFSHPAHSSDTKKCPRRRWGISQLEESDGWGTLQQCMTGTKSSNTCSKIPYIVHLL